MSEEPLDYPQVGLGWAFPPRWDPTGAVRLSSGAEHVREAMVLLLRTGLGERVMRPRFGAGVDRYLFEARTSETCHRLADDVRRALVLGEPRVVVDAVVAEPAGTAEDRIDVRIDFRIDRHRRPTSLVVPFYLVGSP